MEAAIRFPAGAPEAVRVTGPDGRDVPAQVSARDGLKATVVFVARVAPLSFSVFDVSAAAGAGRKRRALGGAPESRERPVSRDAG